jgi:Na+-driven multidrug efflux pump
VKWGQPITFVAPFLAAPFMNPTEQPVISDLGHAPIRSLFFRFYVPSLVSMASIALHQIINGIILGQQLGKEALAAISLYTPVLLVFIAFVLAVVIGGGILFSRSVGAQRYSDARQVFRFCTTLVLLVSSLIALSAPFLTPFLVDQLAAGQSPLIVRYTTECTFWNIVFLPALLLRMLCGGFLSNDNAPDVSRNATMLSAVINIVLDVLLVIVFPFGVAGATIATGLALLAALAYMLVRIRNRNGHIDLHGFRFTLRFADWRELLRSGFPSFVSELSLAVGFLLINRNLLPYGTLAVSAFGVVSLLSNLFLRLFTASMLAVQPIMAFNIGARQPDRVLKTLRFALLFSSVLGIVIFLTGVCLADFMINIVSGNESVAFRQVATQAILLSFVLFLATGANYLLVMYIQIIGKAMLSTTINIVRGFVLIALFLFLLPTPLAMHLNGVWLARPLAEISLLLGLSGYLWFRRNAFFSDDAILKRAS